MIIIADGSVKIDVLLDDSKVSGGIKKVEGRLSGIGGAAKRGLATVGKLAGALGLVGLAYKGIDMVKNSLDGAIARYDTLNNFPRVMKVLGFDAEESEVAINKLSDGIQGLPTRLDEVASTAQNIAVMTGDLDGAVDTTLALNNAFLASGASVADASRGMEVYQNMLATGEVDGQRWKTLQETMGVALSMVAEKAGFEGPDALNKLYDSLKDGTITFDEFNDMLIEANNQQDGLADLARENTDGLATAWMNLQAWIIMGLTDVLEAIDKAMGGVGSMSGLIEKLKPVVLGVFGWIANTAIPKAADAIVLLRDKFTEIVEKAKEVWQALQPWLPLFAAIAAGVGTFLLLANGATIVAAVITKAVAVFNVLKTVIMAVRVAMIALNAAILANPIALLIAAIVAAAVLIYVYWEPISEFFINLWNTIKEAGLLIWENLKEGWSNAKNNLTEAWQSVTEFFSNLWQSIVEVFIAAYEWLNGITGGAFGQYVEIIQAYLMTAWEVVKAVWSYIKDTFSNFLDFIKALVTLDFQGMKDAMKKQMNNAKNLLANIWQAIKSNIGAKLAEILSNVIQKFIEIKNNIQNKINEAKTALVNKFTEMVTNARNKATQIVTTARQKFEEVKQAIRNKLTEAVRVVGQKIGEMPGKVIEKASDMLSAGQDLIKGLIEGIKNMGASAVEAVAGVVDGVVEKAKSLLKISSPSKLFEQFGAWTSEGLAKGIDKMRNLAEKASENLGLGVEGAFEPQLTVDGVKGLSKLKGINVNSLIGNLAPINLESRIIRQTSEPNRQSDLIKNREQPAYITLVLGGREYSAFVRDITETQERTRLTLEAFRG